MQHLGALRSREDFSAQPTLAITFAFAVALSFRSVSCSLVIGHVDGIANVADGLLGLALYLLGSAFHLWSWYLRSIRRPGA